jgi:hypothetical protein
MNDPRKLAARPRLSAQLLGALGWVLSGCSGGDEAAVSPRPNADASDSSLDSAWEGAVGQDVVDGGLPEGAVFDGTVDGLADSPSEVKPAIDAAGPCGCLLGEGPYCAARASAEAIKAGCTLSVLAGHNGDLLKCENDSWSVLETCKGVCSYDGASSKLDDACELPVCDCFVAVAWCGSGAAKEAATMGCKIPLLPEHNGDILYCPNSQWTVKQTCPLGCIEAPKGTPDSCKSNSDYHLPWTCNESHKCSNGNHTSSHTGKDAYAYDFAMHVGTTLRAMRAGEVLRVRMVSTPASACYNGGGSSCANYANTVEILHSDGTVALYMHLSSISVTKGQSIAQGQVVGKSGNSGWSTGPHLHTQVQHNCGIWWCQSVPFKFVENGSISAGVTVASKNCP